MDVLGYTLNEEGVSIDERGHAVDIREFFSLRGKIEANRQRESVYTRKLADKVIENYKRYYVVLTSHLAAFAAFQTLRKMHPAMDIYAIMRLPSYMLSIPMPLFRSAFSRYLETLKEMERAGQIKLQTELHTMPLDTAIRHGIKHVGAFHALWPLKIREKDDVVVVQNPTLTYYYHNRLNGFQLEEAITWDQGLLQQAQEKLQANG
jgi:glycerol-3-phosphate O-acyltransferase